MKKRSIGIIGLACLTAGIGLAGCAGSSDTAQETTTAETTTVVETTTAAETTATTTDTTATTISQAGNIRYEVNEPVYEDDKIKVTFVGMGSEDDGLAAYVFDTVNKKDDGKIIQIRCDEMWANDVQLPISLYITDEIVDGTEKRSFLTYVGEASQCWQV